ncbi:ABC transporter C family member 13 isoform X2 [Telopea speciosissima]|uniref:ABC transporter C family member 13 isoform X2 n=1 Tax=Telopea speciosissima TaxID=54955 RepID=UPI001CC701B7|nr:ABC transporter C family member 13 isoform X2 [Telopea speciosissima]
MELMTFICPKHPTVWDGNGFSECFEHMVLGFGVNVVSIIMIVVLGLSGRNARTSTRIAQKRHSEKVFLHLVPASGAFLPLYDITLLLKRALQGQSTVYHEWFFKCSQFSVWTTIMLFSKCDIWFFIFYHRILCFWWIAKPILGIPHLQTMFSSLKVVRNFKESCSFVLDVVFVIYLNIGRVIRESSSNRKCGSLEDSLISCNLEIEDDLGDSGNTCSYWHTLTFKSINSVMDRGVLKQLDFEDLIQLPIDLNPSTCHSTLQCCWVAEQRKNFSHPSLFRAVCCAYGRPYFRLGLLKVLNDCIGFLGPLLLNKLITFLQQGSSNFEGYIFAISLGLISIFKSFLDTQYTFHLSKLKLKLRSSIMMSIYQKCLHVSLAERSKFSEGEIQTFMSVDADRTVNLCNSFHDMWSLPLQIGVALYLLYTQVKFAFVSGIAITVLLIPVNRWIATLIASATEKMMKQKDERVRRAGELLKNIRTLKMYGWDLLFTNWLMETRSMEVKYLSTRKYLDAWCVFFWATTPTLFSLFTFGVFTLMGNTLDAATVFTCLALFNTLISPLNSFPWVINGLIDALISTRRLSSFLSCSEHSSESVQIAGSSSTLLNIDQPDFIFQRNAVVFRDACCCWSKSNEGQSSVLNQITLNLSKGFLVVVIGEVGSGKSSLLNSILGEMQLTHGSIRSFGSIAYVPQVPWILSGTIRDNILLGKDYHAERYKEVLQTCALDVDISQMLGGDLAYVGEKGVNISGGQRARLALARAVYHGSDIFLLDDVLSAVDAQVAHWILYNCIQGPLMDKSTRVICTHNIQAISSADMIVIMEKGHMKWVGSLSEFSVSPYSTISSKKELKISSPVVRQENGRSTSAKAEENIQEENGVNISGKAQESIEIEMRKEGKVELSVYKNYAAFSGWPIAIAICISAVLMQASRNGNDLWLSHWVDNIKGNHHTMYSTSFYLVILCVFCISNSLLTLVRAFSFAFGGLRAAVQVHNKLLNKLVNAPVHFFNQTPSGRILNRLSSDLYTIDDSLPFILNILLANFIGLMGIAIVLTYVQVLFLLLLLPLLYIYSKLQFYYRSTSRELRRLDSVSRSPIYASFTEALDGSSTIRAFKAEEIFMAKFTENVSVYQQTSYSEITASLWLSLRLQVCTTFSSILKLKIFTTSIYLVINDFFQLLAAFVISFVAVMAIIGSHGSFLVSFGTPGLVGLALSYAAPMVSLLSSFLSSFTETEKEMVSVERVLQYMDVPQEELQGRQFVEADWPFQGQIEFQHVTLRYMPSSPAALHDVTFTIAGGTQVGIVGRTGAGKSSVVNALFRLSPICGGFILVDGINVADVAIRDLRSHFGVVPQSPFLFEGTLRDNLDPSRVTSDAKIWHALEKCHIKEEVETAGGLDSLVKEAGSTFSVGQRQLLCLARAFLKSSKVLCLDECTASVDTQTASVLQSAISSECKGMTVITIAHRISTVLNMNNILVLDQGILVEQGNPQVLLQEESSRFSCFAKASTM